MTVEVVAVERASGVLVTEVQRGIGPPGPAGGIFIAQPFYANEAALPASGALNTAYITEDDGHAWLWDGSAWYDTGPIAVATLPLPLYAITGRDAATIPTGETVIETYANYAAFEADVVPTAAGEQCQLAGYPVPDRLSRLVADWDNVDAFDWGFA